MQANADARRMACECMLESCHRLVLHAYLTFISTLTVHASGYTSERPLWRSRCHLTNQTIFRYVTMERERRRTFLYDGAFLGKLLEKQRVS